MRASQALPRRPQEQDTPTRGRAARPALRRKGRLFATRAEPVLATAVLGDAQTGLRTGEKRAPIGDSSRRDRGQAGPRREPQTAAELAELGGWLDGFLFAQSGPIYAGTNEIQRNIIAERVLGMPRK